MTPDLHAPAADRSAAGRTGSAVYVYGVAPAPAPRAGAAGGVGDPPAPVRGIEAGALAALASDVPAGWTAARREDVEAHERVLSGVIETGTVIPMRFGVVMDSDEHVRHELLERHQDEIGELIRRVDGRVQMSLKAFYPADALLREVLIAQPQLKRRSDALRGGPLEGSEGERIALGRDVAEAVDAQRERDERMLIEPLLPLVVDVHVEPGGGDRLALGAQLLVERERRGELDDAVRKLSERHGERFAFRYVGPLAPYSFTDLSLDAVEEPWG
jgi:hypothetical protein